MKSRREFLKTSAGFAATTLTRGSLASLPLTAPKPNIILILADDLGFSDIGCYGSEIATPHLDRLAASGIKCSQFYNNPRCCPSRASIMTGLYPQQADMGLMVSSHGRYPYPEYDGILGAQTITIPEALKQAGYNTAMVGKWHLATETDEGRRSWPIQRGFDKFWGMVAGISVYFNSPHLMSGNEKLPPPPPDKYLTDLWAEHAAGFVTELAAEKKPFFLYAAFNAPHYPLQAPEAEIQSYMERYAVGWDALREARHQRQIEFGLLPSKWRLSPRDPRVPAWTEAGDKEWEIRRMATYAAMISRLDTGVGQILDAVEKAGIRENTLIVFLSDNGGNSEELASHGGAHGSVSKPDHCDSGMDCSGNQPETMPGGPDSYQSIGIPWGNVANTPFRLYKHFAHEGGISTPFIASWPGTIKPNAKPISNVGHETDLMPTMLELAGVRYPSRVAAGPIPALCGESLVPLFRGKSRIRGPIFWEHQGNRALREGPWKLVSRWGASWELYNMEADRTELTNLATSQPQRAKAMTAEYEAWAKRIGVQPWPIGNTEPVSDELKTPSYLKRYNPERTD